MFGDFGNLMKLLGNKDKIASEMAKLQEATAQMVAEGTAGGGMVQVRVNGRMEMIDCRLRDDALAMNDRAVLEDLIVAATNQANGKAREMLAAETQRMAQSLGIPASMMSQIGGGFGL
jgi:nucleoid-associated protein EbfC